MTRLSSALILTSIALLPFVYTRLTIDPVLLIRYLILGVTTILLLLTLAVERKKQPVDGDTAVLGRNIFVFAVGYCLIALLSLTQSANAGESLFRLAGAITPFIFLGAVTVALVRNPSLVLDVARALSIAVLLLALVGWCQYLDIGFTHLPGNIVPYGTMANKNLLASAVFLCFPFVFYTLNRATLPWRVIGWAATVVSLGLIVISRTRGVWVALVVAAVVTAILAIVYRKKLSSRQQESRMSRRWRLIAPAAVILAVLVAGVYLTGRDGPPLIERVTSIVKMKDQSARDRLGIWKNSLAMSADHPFLGVGPGEWRVHISGYGNVGLRSESGVIHFQRPHNDYLWVLGETGPAGLLAYLLVFACALVYAVRWIKASSEPRAAAEGLTLVFGLVGYMGVAFFSYPQERVFHTVLLMLMIAVVTTSYHRLRPQRRKPPAAALNGALAFSAAVLILGLATETSRLLGEGHLHRMYGLREAGRWEAVIDEIDRAESFFMSMDPMSTPLAWYRGVAQFSLGRHELALTDFESAYRVNPNHIHVLNNLATAHQVVGNRSEAIRFYERVLEISPNFDETLLNLSAVYYNMGEIEKAYDRISRVSPDCPDDRYKLFLDRIMQSRTAGEEGR